MASDDLPFHDIIFPLGPGAGAGALTEQLRLFFTCTDSTNPLGSSFVFFHIVIHRVFLDNLRTRAACIHGPSSPALPWLKLHHCYSIVLPPFLAWLV